MSDGRSKVGKSHFANERALPLVTFAFLSTHVTLLLKDTKLR